ncbi:MAG: quinone-dependent dihydroorotate dehydrogenase [Bacteroidota bacterium]
MYKQAIKPLFFLFPPEKIHQVAMNFMNLLRRIPGGKGFIRTLFQVHHSSLERKVLGLTFPNPVGMAAGFDKEGKYYNVLSDMGFGFVEIGTFTPEGQPGNPKPRLFRVPEDHALINRMGFNNSGAKEAVNRLKKQPPECIVGGNIGKNTATPNNKATDDYSAAFETLYPFVDYFVVNVSCPNITNMKELQDKDALLEILTTVTSLNAKKISPKPVLLKISPDLNWSQIDDTLDIVNKTKIDGIIATNTSISRQNLKTPEKEVEKLGNGGLSGKPIRNRSTEIIRYVAQKTQKTLPIIGVGGIMTPEDAMEKLEAGADLIQVYTGFIYEGPFIAKRINKALLMKK